MKKKLTEIANQLEQIELALRQGEIESILVSVNHGEKSYNIAVGSIIDIATSLSRYCRRNNEQWRNIIKISETLATIQES